MSEGEDKGGRYPNCAQHMLQAGLRITEASAASGISEASIRRIRKGEVVSATTISKLINALNAEHFSKVGAPLNFNAEFASSGE